MHQHAVRRAHVVTAIADRPVDLAVVPKHESVHVVAAQRNTHAVTRRILRDDFRNAVAIAIKQSPEMRDVRVEDFAIEGKQPRTSSIERIVEGTGEERARFRHTVAVAIGELRHAIGILRVVRHAAFALRRPLLVHLESVFDRFARDVVEQPVRTVSVVFNAEVLAIAFGEVEVAAFIDCECHRVI